MLEFLRDAVWQFVGAIVGIVFGLAAIVVSIVLYRRARQRKAVEYEVVANAPILADPAATLSNLSIQVLVNGEEANDVRLLLVRILNTGNVSIHAGDYAQPLRIALRNAEARLLTAEVGATTPADIPAKVTIVDEKCAELAPVLLNAGDMVEVALLVKDFPSPLARVPQRMDDVGTIERLLWQRELDSWVPPVLVYGRIAGVKEVQEVRKRGGPWGWWTSPSPVVQAVFAILAIVALLVSLFLLSLSKAEGAPRPQDWSTIAVDCTGTAGLYVEMAVDQAGDVHLVYAQEQPELGTLRYATRQGSTWTSGAVQTPGGTPLRGWYLSLALDAQGGSHLAYFDPATLHLVYAAPVSATAWTPQTVDATLDAGRHAALALDAAGRPHIAYLRVVNPALGHLRYAHFDGSQWFTTTVDLDVEEDADIALVLDTAGRPHVSYNTPGGLKYAYFDGMAWTSTTAVAGVDTGWSSDLDLGPGEQARISYCDMFFGQVRYVQWDGATWHVTTVGSGNCQGDTSLALDYAGRPHISYYAQGDKLYYARSEGTGWYLESIDAGALTGRFSALHVEENQLAVAYFDETNGCVRYGERTLPFIVQRAYLPVNWR